jgi:hypothetical protein
VPDSPAFHSVPLRFAAGRLRCLALPHRAANPKERHCPQARAAKPPYRSTALHFEKTGETGFPTPASASPVLAPETLPASLAAAAASVMRWPPILVWPLVGQAKSSLPPPLLSLPAQKPEQRGPRDPNNARQTPAFSTGRTGSASPLRSVLKAGDWRLAKRQLHLWPSVLRARPYGSPRPPENHGLALRTTAQK